MGNPIIEPHNQGFKRDIHDRLSEGSAKSEMLLSLLAAEESIGPEHRLDTDNPAGEAEDEEP